MLELQALHRIGPLRASLEGLRAAVLEWVLAFAALLPAQRAAAAALAMAEAKSDSECATEAASTKALHAELAELYPATQARTANRRADLPRPRRASSPAKRCAGAISTGAIQVLGLY